MNVTWCWRVRCCWVWLLTQVDGGGDHSVTPQCRAWQAAQAVASVATDYVGDLQRGVVQPPPRVLRRLFERLGSTYIKLGQVTGMDGGLRAVATPVQLFTRHVTNLQQRRTNHM